MRFYGMGLAVFKKLLETPLAFLLERALRLQSYLNPSAWPNAKRIEVVHKGKLSYGSGEVAVFAASYTEAYPAFFMNLFEALKEARIDVLIVSNKNLSPENVAYLQGHSRWLLIRKNIGRDFGAYADSLKFLEAENVSIERLFFFNDSLYYRSVESLTPLINGLRGGDFTCATASLRPVPHAQSFCMSFGKEVLSHAAFRQYWSKYLHVNTRRWAISKGELGLSITLRKANFLPQAVYSSFDVGRALQSAQKLGDREMILNLPQISAIQTILTSHAVKPLSVARGGSTSNLHASLTQLSAQISYSIAMLRPDGAQPSPGNALNTRNTRDVADFFLSEELLQELLVHSPVHSCGLLWWRHADFPLLKRDILFRGVFSANQIGQFLQNEPAVLARPMTLDLRRRHEGRLLRGWEGFLFRKGFL